MGRRISFIGVGNMANAIIGGITSRTNNPISWSDLVLYNRHAEKIIGYEKLGAVIASDLSGAVSSSDCIILCVKPQNFEEILPELAKIPNVQNKLFISIAAGITTETISIAANFAPVVRAMPNTPMLIGHGVTALCRNDKVSDTDMQFAVDIFSSAGSTIVLNESEMNRIISVSGSSPAYVFMLIKAMYDGAVDQGLLKTDDATNGISEDEIIDVICDTIIGSALLMKAEKKSPNEQIKRVCSKGGTTEQAVMELEKYRFYDAFISAMRRCTVRADELGIANK